MGPTSNSHTLQFGLNVDSISERYKEGDTENEQRYEGNLKRKNCTSGNEYHGGEQERV